MSITIDELARIAGVSKTTVSRVLNKRPDVHPATRQKILSLIEQYDFQPNAFAKAISLQKSMNIGLIIPHQASYVFSNPFYTEVMRGVSTEVDRQNYYLLLCYAHEHNYLDIYRQKRVDGFVLLSPGSFHKDIVETLNNENVPFVSTAQISDEDKMVYVDVDNYRAAESAIQHLISLGHKRIAYIGKPTLKSSQDRRDGYRAALTNAGIRPDDDFVIVTESSSIESGYSATQTLLSLELPPTAIFLANDVMALGAINAIQACGMRVPEDISVMGFDDIPLASIITPNLTTVWQPAFEKGTNAARILIEYLQNGNLPQSLILDTHLVVRKSTGLVKP